MLKNTHQVIIQSKLVFSSTAPDTSVPGRNNQILNTTLMADSLRDYGLFTLLTIDIYRIQDLQCVRRIEGTFNWYVIVTQILCIRWDKD